jgi:hypothetical protein
VQSQSAFECRKGWWSVAVADRGLRGLGAQSKAREAAPPETGTHWVDGEGFAAQGQAVRFQHVVVIACWHQRGEAQRHVRLGGHRPCCGICVWMWVSASRGRGAEVPDSSPRRNPQPWGRSPSSMAPPAGKP